MKKSGKIYIDIYVILVFCAFCYDSLLRFLIPISARIPFVKTISNEVPIVVILFLVLMNLAKGNFKKITAKDILFVFTMLLALSVSYMLFPETRQYFNELNMRGIFFGVIPFFLLGVDFDASEKTVKWITYGAYISILIRLAYTNYFLQTRELGHDNMYGAYTMLPHTLLCIRAIFDDEIPVQKWLKVVLAVVASVFVMSMGTRGPVLIILAYTLVLMWNNLIKGKRGKIFVIIAFAVAGYAVMSGAYLQVLDMIRDLFESIGLSTRVIDMFFENEYISNTSGRDKIYEMLIEKIEQSPVYGYGIFGEWQYVGYSAHNLPLQMFMHYGIIGGMVIMLMYVYFVAKAIYVAENRRAKEIIIMYAVFVAVRGVFGGDYLRGNFFFLLGLSLNQIREHNKAKKERKREAFARRLK